jgi:hypothetical protein
MGEGQVNKATTGTDHTSCPKDPCAQDPSLERLTPPGPLSPPQKPFSLQEPLSLPHESLTPPGPLPCGPAPGLGGEAETEMIKDAGQDLERHLLLG